MSWGEALRLVAVLAADPSSHLAASINEWKHPRSPEWLVLADLFDVTAQAHFQKPKPYPRPYRDPNAKHHGRTDLHRADVIDLLNQHGHDFDPSA